MSQNDLYGRKASSNQPSLAGDSHVSPTALQENVKHLAMSVISGQNCGELFAKLNPDGSWVKTSQDSVQVRMDGSLVEYCETWPRWGMLLGGVVGKLPMSGRRTTENGSSLLPTPTTPRPHDNERTAGLYLESQNQKDLTYAIAMIPTLTTNTGKNTSPGINFEMREKKCQLDGVFMNHVGKRTGLQLQPAFAEWMMGFPIGYTDLRPSEMPSSRSKCTLSLKQSRKSKGIGNPAQDRRQGEEEDNKQQGTTAGGKRWN